MKKPQSDYDLLIAEVMGLPSISAVWDFARAMPPAKVQLIFQTLGLPWKVGDDDFEVRMVNSRPVASARVIAVAHLQNIWYRQHEPLGHDLAKLDADQHTRVLTYREVVTAPRVSVDRPQTFQRKDLAYTLAAKPSTEFGVFLGPKLKGQQLLIYNCFKKHAKPMTCTEVTDCLVKGGFTCNQDPYRAVYYYLNEWKKRGWLV